MLEILVVCTPGNQVLTIVVYKYSRSLMYLCASVHVSMCLSECVCVYVTLSTSSYLPLKLLNFPSNVNIYPEVTS